MHSGSLHGAFTSHKQSGSASTLPADISHEQLRARILNRLPYADETAYPDSPLALRLASGINRMTNSNSMVICSPRVASPEPTVDTAARPLFVVFSHLHLFTESHFLQPSTFSSLKSIRIFAMISAIIHSFDRAHRVALSEILHRPKHTYHDACI